MLKAEKSNTYNYTSTHKQQRNKSRAQLRRYKRRLNLSGAKGKINLKSLQEIDMYA